MSTQSCNNQRHQSYVFVVFVESKNGIERIFLIFSKISRIVIETFVLILKPLEKYLVYQFSLRKYIGKCIDVGIVYLPVKIAFFVTVFVSNVGRKRHHVPSNVQIVQD